MYITEKLTVFLFSFSAIIHYGKTTLTTNSTLQLVHVLFRHGDRTTDARTLYPKDPHINETYYPYGLGELTNKGKQREYTLGKTLRARYGEFLPEIYTPDLLEAWSSDVNRTKTSVQLVLAGLFPPVKEQIWEEGFSWQPIPFKTVPTDQDTLFLGFLCPNYKKLYNERLESPKTRKEFTENSKTLDYLLKNTGVDVKTYWQLFHIYMCLTTEKEFGLPLPEWTQKVYPGPLRNLTIESYFFNTATTEMKRLTSGYLLKKIIDDSNAKANDKTPNKKIFLYSGHELNVAHMLNTLDIFEPHIPPYGSYILFELHKVDGIFGFRILYQDYSCEEPKILKLPACNDFCPLDEFSLLLEEYFPEKTSCGLRQ